MKIRSFITHKLQEQYSDCQDRFCIDSERKRIAVSDGMGQSIFPEYWADILSAHYVQNGHCTEEERVVLCKKWLDKVNAYFEEQKALGKNPWMLQNFLTQKKGAGATLCGVTFDDASHWHGHVLGDTCAIEIDIENKCVLRILTSEEKSFDCYPDYLDSFVEKPGRGTFREIEGEISNSKCLLIVSDPFAEYLQQHTDVCDVFIENVLGLDSHDSYCLFVDSWREKGLHNDDSTMCIIEFDNNSAFNISSEDNIVDLIEKEEKVSIDENVEEEKETQVEEEKNDSSQSPISKCKEPNDAFAEMIKTIPSTTVGKNNGSVVVQQKNEEESKDSFESQIRQITTRYTEEIKRKFEKKSGNTRNKITVAKAQNIFVSALNEIRDEIIILIKQ